MRTRTWYLYIGTAVVLLVLAANAVARFRSTQHLIENEVQVVHTQAVLLQLERLESLLKDAETGQRGFLYTGNEAYLAPYQSATRELLSQIDELARLTAKDPTQQTRLAALRVDAQEKLDELAHTIDLVRTGKSAEARALVLTDFGKQKMDAIRGQIATMKDEELRLERARSAESQGGVHSAFVMFVITNVLAGLAVLALAAMVVRDLRAREVAAAALRERENWLQTTLQSIGDGVIATDPEGRVTFLNTAAEQLTGFNNDVARGKSVSDIYPVVRQKGDNAGDNPVRKVIEQGSVVSLANHTVLRRADGKEFDIADTAAPIRDGHGKMTGVVMVVRDLTERARSELALRKADQLATAGRLAATVSHEINNPLESLTNLLFLLQSEPSLSAPAREFVAMAQEETARLGSIARRTLSFYRDKGKPEMVDLCKLLDDIMEVYRSRLASRNISVVSEFESVPLIKANVGEIRQVMVNLVVNAMDALDHNGELRVCVRHDRERKGVQIELSDNGPGIAAENLPHIFEPFFTTKRESGTGLGLWVSKGLIEKHGGELSLTSSTQPQDHGTCFKIFLPHADGQSSAFQF